MVSDQVKLEREKRKTARQQRAHEREQMVLDRVLTPNVIRLGLLCGIIAYSTYCARSAENVGPVQSALAFALPGLGIPLIAADAGIHDKYALAAISATSISYASGQMVLGWKEAGLFSPKENSLADKLQDALLPLLG
jgi:hypothetical protein